MALVSKSIPNLINGVSQQPPALRLESQGELQENGFSDVVEGLKKRFPTTFIKSFKRAVFSEAPQEEADRVYEELTEEEIETAFFHTYKRSNTEIYTVVIFKPLGLTSSAADSDSEAVALCVYDEQGSLRYQAGVGSWDADGVPIPIDPADQDAATRETRAVQNLTNYMPIASFNNNKLKAVSVSDYTFLVNTDTTVESSGVEAASRPYEALVYLKSVNYSRQYDAIVKPKPTENNLGQFLEIASADSTYTTQSAGSDGNNQQALKTSTVIENLRDGLYAGSDGAGGQVNTSQYNQTFANRSIDRYRNWRDNVRNKWQSTWSRYVLESSIANAYAADPTAVHVSAAGRVLSPNEYVINGTDLQILASDHLGFSGRSWTKYVNVRIKEVSVTVDADLISGTVYAEGVRLLPPVASGEPFFIISSPDADFQLQVNDDDGGINLKGFKDQAKSFTDLPQHCLDGFQIGVVGDNFKEEDNFHVRYTGDSGQGVWQETVKAGLDNSYNLATMPHVLIQNADLSFEFSEGRWEDRIAGDEETNPFPSFVGKTISDVFFHRNRLGILAGENVIFSAESGFFNFFRTTVRSLLDADPIDVAVSQNEVSLLKAAVPFQDNLILFSEQNQFALSAENLLTPAGVVIDRTTKFECDLDVTRPVTSGATIFFPTIAGDFAGIREYSIGASEVQDAPLATSHVPKYLRGRVIDMVASPNEQTMALLTDYTDKEIYIYRWYDSDNGRVQSSWSKWTFDVGVKHLFFSNADLYIVFSDARWEKMSTASESKQFLSTTILSGGYDPADLEYDPVSKTYVIRGYAPTQPPYIDGNRGQALPYWTTYPTNFNDDYQGTHNLNTAAPEGAVQGAYGTFYPFGGGNTNPRRNWGVLGGEQGGGGLIQFSGATSQVPTGGAPLLGSATPLTMTMKIDNNLVDFGETPPSWLPRWHHHFSYIRMTCPETGESHKMYLKKNGTTLLQQLAADRPSGDGNRYDTLEIPVAAGKLETDSASGKLYSGLEEVDFTNRNSGFQYGQSIFAKSQGKRFILSLDSYPSTDVMEYPHVRFDCQSAGGFTKGMFSDYWNLNRVALLKNGGYVTNDDELYFDSFSAVPEEEQYLDCIYDSLCRVDGEMLPSQVPPDSQGTLAQFSPDLARLSFFKTIPDKPAGFTTSSIYNSRSTKHVSLGFLSNSNDLDWGRLNIWKNGRPYYIEKRGIETTPSGYSSAEVNGTRIGRTSTYRNVVSIDPLDFPDRVGVDTITDPTGLSYLTSWGLSNERNMVNLGAGVEAFPDNEIPAGEYVVFFTPDNQPWDHVGTFSFDPLLLQMNGDGVTYGTPDITVSAQVNLVELNKYDVLLDHRKTIVGTPVQPFAFDTPDDLRLEYPITTKTQFVSYLGELLAEGNSDAELNKVIDFLKKQHVADDVVTNNYVYAGEPYTFKYTFSEQVFEPMQGERTKMGRLQLRNIRINYNNTGAFSTVVESIGRDPSTKVFSSAKIGTVESLVGYQVIEEDGTYPVSVQAKAESTSISLINNTHLPSIFQSAELEAHATLRSQRR